MTRFVRLLCLIVPVLCACNTTGDPASSDLSDAAPSYTGTFPRPLSDTPPADKEEADARVHTQVGQEYFFSFGHTDAALDAAKAALKKKPGYPPAYHLMGLIYMELKQNALADDSFRQALSAAPGDPDFNNSYGWFLCSQGKLSEALSRFATAVANPYYHYKTRPYINAGLCLLENGAVDRAESQFARALEVAPSNGEALYRLSEVAYRRGNYRRAHDILIQYHQRFDPSARSVWLGLLAARRLGERHAEASYTEQLRGRFSDSRENVLMMQGKYGLPRQTGNGPDAGKPKAPSK
ncbi:MAG: type IV pilus biogenesis/stability protein PilW [Azoarcus sp.]|jgi:type IV pilus assembly protein PilF|nr:type IV pilus biogenesis/stability protein PilW [Azoarcus sp.]